jgi:photosystem II stability/assembly factor-like uncharacterized protein
VIARVLSTIGTVAGLFVVLPALAIAHGRFPQTGQIVWDPSDDNRIVVRATFGLVESRDGGESWRWICREVASIRDFEDPKIAVMGDGSLLVPVFDGLLRTDPTACDWGFASPELTDEVTIDQSVSSSDPATSFVVTSSGGDAVNRVYVTRDNGQSWSATSDGIDPILFESIRAAPSDSARLYLAGAYPPTAESPRRPFIYRSSDGGETWTAFPFADFRPDDHNIYLLGVDPLDPNRLFVRVRAVKLDDRVVESRDGGETWTEVLTLPDVVAFAWSDEGMHIAIGGRAGVGLWLSEDGGATFTQVQPELELGCASFRGDELWACGNNALDGFAIGRSTDAGRSFEPVFTFEEIDGLLVCAEDSEVERECRGLVLDLYMDLGLDAGIGPDAGTPLDAGPDRDAGTPARPGRSIAGGGCSCMSASGVDSTPTSGGLGVLLAAAWLIVWRRSRS